MLKPILQWAIPLLGLLALGPAVSLPIRSLTDAAGRTDVTLLYNTNPAIALAVGLLALVLAAALAAATARFFGPRPGMTTAALLLLWPVWMLGSAREALAAGANPWLFPAEGLLAAIAILALAAVAGTFGTTGQGVDVFFNRKAQPARLLKPAGLAGIAVGAVVSILGVWLAARSDAPGQAMFATALGAFAAGIAGRFAAEQLDESAPPIAPIVGVALAAILCPLVGILAGSGDLATDAAAGTLAPWLRVQPAAWIVGACFGVMPGLATAHKPAEDPVPAKA